MPLVIEETSSIDAPAAMPPSGAHYLQAGFLHVGRATTISTILGSCVAVCLWDASQNVGGMNHFLLPRGVAIRGTEGRFGEYAVGYLLEKVIDAGAHLGQLQAKVFGGASVNGVTARADHLGIKNAEIAFRLLAEAQIPIVAQDVGGTRGRKLLFHTGDGTAFMKYL